MVVVDYDHVAKKWRLTVHSSNSLDAAEETLIFDHLIVATGSFKKPLFEILME